MNTFRFNLPDGYGRKHNYGEDYKAILTDTFQQTMNAFDKLRPPIRDLLNHMLTPQDPIAVLIEQQHGASDKFLIDALRAFDVRWHKELVDKKRACPQPDGNFQVRRVSGARSGLCPVADAKQSKILRIEEARRRLRES